MRRSWRALLTTAFCIVVCTVCLALPALAQTTVSVYHRNELREIEWMEQVKEAFEAANPDIKIELIQGIDGGGPGYAERLAVLFASGNPPDVFYGSTDKAGFVLNGWARDITDLIEHDRAAMNLDEFFPGVFDSVTRRGRIFGVPTIAMGHAIFYNKQLLSEAGLALPPTDWDDGGWDWTEFVEYAQKLTHAHPDGTLQQAGISSIGITDAARLFGAEWFPPEAFETGIATHVTLLQPEMEQAYTEIQKLYSELRVSSGQSQLRRRRLGRLLERDDRNGVDGLVEGAQLPGHRGFRLGHRAASPGEKPGQLPLHGSVVYLHYRQRRGSGLAFRQVCHRRRGAGKLCRARRLSAVPPQRFADLRRDGQLCFGHVGL